ncbi:AMP-binding protein [Thermoactinomyces mirandus]|uniref:AMP-binding protein n=1 Tax=Thermoactinomyces mirandus TaxID=2756294 RepID=A0A7W2AQ48_9BACL|nr:AMP-binding protein [Thermoactinomyces mirandus]MBA4601118.1 AMP-binding protein [Thermoactinomyces mirandus]
MKFHNLLEMLANTVRRFPEKTALSWEENGKIYKLTYQRLWNMIRDFALGLEKIGIRPGAKIALIAENHPRWVISEFAVFSLGAVSVPIAPDRHPKQIREILSHADTEGVITDQYTLLEKLKDKSSGLKHYILLYGEAKGDQRALQFDTIIQIGQAVSTEEMDWAYPAIQPSEVAILHYSNECAEANKGVMLSHSNLINNLESFLYAIPYSKHDHFLSILSLSHPFERIAGYLAPLASGAEISYLSKKADWLTASQYIKPTMLVLTPTLIQTIYGHLMKQIRSSSTKYYLFQKALQQAEKIYELKSKGYNWPMSKSLELKHSLFQTIFFAPVKQQLGGQVRFVLSGGTPLPVQLHRFFWCIDLPIVEGYYLPECASVISATSLTHPHPGTAGKPLPGIELRIQTDGELLIKCPHVILGYYKVPLSEMNGYSNGWISTGDYAEMDAEGSLRAIRRRTELDPKKAVLPTAVKKECLTGTKA